MSFTFSYINKLLNNAIQLLTDINNSIIDIGTDLATETTLLELKTIVNDSLTVLNSIDLKVATETTLQSIETVLNTVSSTLTSIDNKVATEATLLLLKTAIDGIKLQTDKLTFEDNRLLVNTGESNINLNLDAGGRLRVSELTTLIDLKQLADKAPLFINLN